MRKWFIKFTDGEDVVRSFTFAETVQRAEVRITEQMADKPDIWGGWTFEITGSTEELY